MITTQLPAHAQKDAVTKENANKQREGRNQLGLETIHQELLQNPVEQKMVKNVNFHSFIRGKNTKLVLRILMIQMKLGVPPEQTERENMLEEVDIMDSGGIIVQKFDI